MTTGGGNPPYVLLVFGANEALLTRYIKYVRQRVYRIYPKTENTSKNQGAALRAMGGGTLLPTICGVEIVRPRRTRRARGFALGLGFVENTASMIYRLPLRLTKTNSRRLRIVRNDLACETVRNIQILRCTDDDVDAPCKRYVQLHALAACSSNIVAGKLSCQQVLCFLRLGFAR